MKPVRLWRVPITIVEYGRKALIEASSKREAREKGRQAEWTDISEAIRFNVRVSGSVTEDS